MTDKLELKSSHEVVYTVYAADVESIFYCKPDDPDILTVLMKDGKRLYCDEVCPIDSLQEEPVELKEVDLEDAKKEELAQKYVDYTFKRHNIDANSKEGQLIYYAYMHGMNQCLNQLKAQKGEEVWHKII